MSYYLTDSEIEFTLDGSSLTCSTHSNDAVNSIELLDADQQRIAGPVENTSSLSLAVNNTNITATYFCRVITNSTLGIRRLSIPILSMNEEITSRSEISVTKAESPMSSYVFPVIASAATLLMLLLMILLLACIIIIR